MASSVIGALRVNLGLDSGAFIRDMGKATKKAESSTASMGAAFRRLAGVVGAAFSVTEIVRLADTYSGMTAQLRLVTAGTRELAEVESQLFAIAQQNRVGFESTVELYARIARSTEALGVSQAEALRVTDTINKALIISGTSASQASGALMQLGQAFASGTLRGDELNSVLEGMPRVAQAIAEGMGITVGQLREMGAQGRLTGEGVFNALLKMSQGIDEEFGRMPVTVGQALTMVGNSVLRLVGEFDGASNSSATLSGSIVQLSQTLDGAAGFVRGFGAEIDKAFQGLAYLAGQVRRVADTFLSYYIPAVERARDAMRWLGVPMGRGSGGNSLLGVVGALKSAAASSPPPINSMTASVNRASASLGSFRPAARAASASIRGINQEAEEAARKLQVLMDRLFPAVAQARKLREERELIENSGLSDEQKANARFRLGTEGLGKATVSPWLNANEAIKSTVDELGTFRQESETQTVRIAETFAQMSQRITSSLSGLANSIRSGDFLGILGGAIDLFTQLGSAGAFGKGLQGRLNVPSFDGGGFTGMGARTGGLDGKGGYLAMVHPNEYVSDLTKGGGAGRVHVTVGVDPRNGNITAYVNDQIAATAPAIASAGAGLAQAQMAQRAQRRVR